MARRDDRYYPRPQPGQKVKFTLIAAETRHLGNSGIDALTAEPYTLIDITPFMPPALLDAIARATAEPSRSSIQARLHQHLAWRRAAIARQTRRAEPEQSSNNYPRTWYATIQHNRPAHSHAHDLGTEFLQRRAPA